MKTEALFLFLILLLGLVLCSFLGGSQCYNNLEGFSNSFDASLNHHRYNKHHNSNHYSNYNNHNSNYNNQNSNSNNDSNSNNEYQKGTYINNNKGKPHYDNYNHYSKTISPLTNGQIFHGPNGGSVTVITNSDGSQSLQITTANGGTPITYTNQKPSSTSSEGYTNYYGQNGTATVFYGPNGSTATVINGNNGQDAISVNTTTGTVVYTLDSTYNQPVNNPPGYNPVGTGTTTVYNPPGYNPVGTAGYYNPPGYNPPGTGAATVYNPPGYNPPGTSTINPWASALPPGIPYHQIPPGQEDLYILKSEIVPPVCPACNNNATQNAQCPPCQPCQRCELPPFECKKVPNYSAISDEYQPVPVLNDFSSFGM
jgi:hypothetical protein